jgi:hypothetical protein
MPYVDKLTKRELDAGAVASTVGELTYCVTMQGIRLGNNPLLYSAVMEEINAYLLGKREDGYDANYALLCGVVGSLECARREFQRRRPDDHLTFDEAVEDALADFYDNVVAPYEDTKIEQNGDVFV